MGQALQHLALLKDLSPDACPTQSAILDFSVGCCRVAGEARGHLPWRAEGGVGVALAEDLGGEVPLIRQPVSMEMMGKPCTFGLK